jgi:LuxR family quorum-sensing system transcriptional regulator CciR
MQLVEGAIAAMQARQSSADITAEFVAAARHLGFEKYSFVSRGRHVDGRNFEHISTNYAAEWRARVRSQNYLEIDPTLRRARRSQLPFTWSDLRDSRGLLPMQRQLFDEAGSAGLRHGFTVPVHTMGGGAGAVALAGDMSAREFDSAIQHHRHTLHVLALHFHSLNDAAARAEADAARHAPSANEDTEVTSREAECLLWTARGKSAWEAGMVLGISERTVNFHVETARRKLNAQTKTQAVVQAIMLSLIRP